MRHAKTVQWIGGLLAVTLALTALASGTAFAVQPGPQGARITHCSTLVDRQGAVLAQTCEEQVLAAGSPVESLPLVAVAPMSTKTLLVRVFEHANYGGHANDFYGNDGPCDFAGYSIQSVRIPGVLFTPTSSYHLYNRCDTASYWDDNSGLTPPFSGKWSGWVSGWNVPYVGNEWNDKIASMKVINGS